MSVLVDSYSESNKDSSVSVYTGTTTSAKGQSFTGNGQILEKVVFYLQKTGSPTGNCVAYIYNHTGTFGTSSLPLGTPSATSATLDVSTIITSFNLVEFTFSGANRITLNNGLYYVVVFEYLGGNATNNINIGGDNSSPSHSGNRSYYHTTNGWTVAINMLDMCFYVYSNSSFISGLSTTTGFNTITI